MAQQPKPFTVDTREGQVMARPRNPLRPSAAARKRCAASTSRRARASGTSTAARSATTSRVRRWCSHPAAVHGHRHARLVRREGERRWRWRQPARPARCASRSPARSCKIDETNRREAPRARPADARCARGRAQEAGPSGRPQAVPVQQALDRRRGYGRGSCAHAPSAPPRTCRTIARASMAG